LGEKSQQYTLSCGFTSSNGYTVLPAPQPTCKNMGNDSQQKNILVDACHVSSVHANDPCLFGKHWFISKTYFDNSCRAAAQLWKLPVEVMAVL
jgi:hypothetical protein